MRLILKFISYREYKLCTVLTTVLVGLTGHTNDIEWMQYSH